MSWGADYASADESHPPDLVAFRAAGGSFIWLRASFAEYVTHGAWRIVPDPTFIRDWANLRAAGLVRGAYMGPAISASHSPEEQVGVFHAAVQAQRGLVAGEDFPPCLDIEFPQGIAGTGLDRAGVLAWLKRAVAEVRRLFGCWPILYTSGRVWNGSDTDCLGDPDGTDFVACDLWLARYGVAARQPAILPPPENFGPVVPHPWGNVWTAIQEQGDALGVPGLSSTADVDRFRTARPGDRGGHIARYRNRLKLSAGDVYDAPMAVVVMAVQRAHGLAADAIIGPKTYCALASLPTE